MTANSTTPTQNSAVKPASLVVDTMDGPTVICDRKKVAVRIADAARRLYEDGGDPA